MNRGMTVRGGITISSSSRCLLAESMLRDTANESRYDGSWRHNDKLVIPLLVSGAAV
ncbi:hypothetical protein [Wolbachia endosymbiont (group A) of Rhinocyllus conicus]|uniref:hypothetical protein n=1 Tax=Wolbachia endosymbiont (group A) of Rhinocyllus conicus TaxID=2954053 RepID=UPI002227A1C6|nr:hypothetical protein [Wolbachia endosymbiont (group A) of Rhinocyllus conicus]